jgi:hypothetical protein
MKNQSELVYIGFTLYGITGIDEIEQKLTTTGWLDIQWTDEFLILATIQFHQNPVLKIHLPSKDSMQRILNHILVYRKENMLNLKHTF